MKKKLESDQQRDERLAAERLVLMASGTIGMFVACFQEADPAFARVLVLSVVMCGLFGVIAAYLILLFSKKTTEVYSGSWFFLLTVHFSILVIYLVGTGSFPELAALAAFVSTFGSWYFSYLRRWN